MKNVEGPSVGELLETGEELILTQPETQPQEKSEVTKAYLASSDEMKINSIRKELTSEISGDKDIMERVSYLNRRASFIRTYMNKCLKEPESVLEEEKTKVKKYIQALAGKNVKDQNNIDRVTTAAQSISTDGFIKNPEYFKKQCESFAFYYEHLAEKEYVKLTGRAPSPITKRFPEANIPIKNSQPKETRRTFLGRIGRFFGKK